MPGDPRKQLQEEIRRGRQAFYGRLARDAVDTTARLEKAYQARLAGVTRAIREFEDRTKGGEGPTLGGLETLREKLERELDDLQDAVVDVSAQLQNAGAEDGVRAGIAALQRGGVSATYHLPTVETIQAGISYVDSAAWRAAVGKLARYHADAAADAVLDAIARGINPRQTARWLRAYFNESRRPMVDALRMARTTQLYAAREGTRQIYERTGVEQWIWSANLGNPRTCFSCVCLHGTVHSVDEILNDHHQGRCLTPGQLVVTSEGEKLIEHVKAGDHVLTHEGRYRRVLALSRREYRGVVFHLRQGEAGVTVTPEHPILSQRGWLEARDCSASDTFWTLYDVLTRVSSRNTVQPREVKYASLRRSIGRLTGELCQRESYSTASLTAGNAKSMLNVETANWGTGLSPAARSASNSSYSPAFMNVSQRSWRERAMESARRRWTSGAKAFLMWGLVFQERLAAALASMGSMLLALIQRMSVRVLMFSSRQISRYVAFSATYRRMSHSPIGSPSWASISASNAADSIAPWVSGVCLSPSALARCNTALRVRPGRSAAMSSAYSLPKLDRIMLSSSSDQRTPAISTPLDADGMGISIQQHGGKIEFWYSGPVFNLQVEEDESYIAGGIVVHNCAPIPVTPKWAELGLTSGRDVTIETGIDWFVKQPADQQAAMMGPKFHKAWTAGAFRLEQVPRLYHNDIFGPMWRKSTLAELLAG